MKTFPEFFLKILKKKNWGKILYTNYIKIHHYCKKGIAGKKSNVQTLHPASRQSYTVARPQVMPNDGVRSGRTLKNKPEEGSHAIPKVLLHKHNLLSERLGMEDLQSAFSESQPGKIILKVCFWIRSSCCLRCDCTLLLQTWQAHTKTDRTRAQYIWW